MRSALPSLHGNRRGLHFLFDGFLPGLVQLTINPKIGHDFESRLRAGGHFREGFRQLADLTPHWMQEAGADLDRATIAGAAYQTLYLRDARFKAVLSGAVAGG